MKVDTGILGLGKDLYIPAEFVNHIRDDRVFLTVDKDRVDDLGWDQRPVRRGVSPALRPLAVLCVQRGTYPEATRPGACERSLECRAEPVARPTGLLKLGGPCFNERCLIPTGNGRRGVCGDP